MNNENQPLSTDGNSQQKEDQLGGTTNLSLEQLQKEGGTSDSDKNNPEPSNAQDDLNEIRVGDDLEEPNVDEYQPDMDEADDEEGSDQNTVKEESEPNNADGNG
jgi:hypothetical protein